MTDATPAIPGPVSPPHAKTLVATQFDATRLGPWWLAAGYIAGAILASVLAAALWPHTPGAVYGVWGFTAFAAIARASWATRRRSSSK